MNLCICIWKLRDGDTKKNLWNCKSFSLYTRMYKYLMCNNSIFHGDYLMNYWCVNSYNVQSAFYGCNKSTYCF